MKRIVLIVFLSVAPVLAHDHVEVGKLTQNATQLAMFGPDIQVAVYVPRGEPFSGYMTNFPGGHHAVELTFKTEDAPFSAADANPRIEFVSVTGPSGGNFSFWEVNATQPTWTRAAGWSSAPGSGPTFPVAVIGDGHVHGRCFTMDKPGTYTATFRAVASVGSLGPSTNKTITFSTTTHTVGLRLDDGR